jgi:hypothetical protein
MDITSRAARDPELSDQGQIDFGGCWAKLNLGAYLDFARRLMNADEPEGLVSPDAHAEPSSIEGRVNNLFFGALGWILLHEIAHVHHGDSALIPASMRVGQEYRADAFATAWVLDEAGAGLQREFRVLIVTTALAWLFLYEQARGHGTDHPAAIFRFREAVEKFAMGDRSVGLENATYMLKAIFDPEGDMPRGMLAREAFEWICIRLEARFAPSS